MGKLIIMRTINNLVLHCSATPQNTTVESILRYWKEEKKWKNPGYHWIIKANGEAVNLLPIEQVSNGVSGHNSDSIHISYIGGVDSKGNPIDNRTSAQIKTQKELLLKYHRMFPKARLVGHRDFKNIAKACPSFDVYTWLIEEALKPGI